MSERFAGSDGRPTADEVLADSILHMSRAGDNDGRERIFVVGPFASRVNFFRQQNRALNLAWALSTKPAYVRKQVAVIGAGLAGATAALALRGIGCTVTLYDLGPAPMWRQLPAHHRVAHPNVNFWPDVDPDPSTDFPFLNWLATTAAVIAADLTPEWDHLEQTVTVWHTTPVDHLEASTDSVKVVTAGHPDRDGTFSYVVLASGFLDEDPVPGIDTRGYWHGARFSPPLEHEAPLFVSGAGDGGLIEALSLCHTRFNAGRLIITTAQSMFDGPAMDDIKVGEKRILAAAKQRADDARAAARASRGSAAGAAPAPAPAPAAAGAPVRKPKPPNPANDAIAVEDRRRLYEEAVRGIPPEVLKDLERSLNPKTGVSVYLIAAGPAPYVADAAPIHKLLIAHAIARGRVEHIRGRIAEDGTLQPPPAGIAFDPNRTVPRHGAPFNVGLLSAEEIDDLRTRQGDFINSTLDARHWRPDIFRNRLLRTGAAAEDFVSSHGLRAGRLGELLPEIVVSASVEQRCFEYQVVHGHPEPMPPRRPETLFGVPLIPANLTRGEVGT